MKAKAKQCVKYDYRVVLRISSEELDAIDTEKKCLVEALNHYPIKSQFPKLDKLLEIIELACAIRTDK